MKRRRMANIGVECVPQLWLALWQVKGRTPNEPPSAAAIYGQLLAATVGGGGCRMGVWVASSPGTSLCNCISIVSSSLPAFPSVFALFSVPDSTAVSTDACVRQGRERKRKEARNYPSMCKWMRRGGQRECLQLGIGSRPHVEHTWKVLSENAASSCAASTASTSATPASVSASTPASRTFPFPANWILMEMPLLKCPLAQFRGIAMRRLLHICPCYVSAAAGAAWLPSRPHVCATSPSPAAAYSLATCCLRLSCAINWAKHSL